MPLLRRSKDVIVRAVAGETLLVPVRGHMADLKGVFALNEVAKFVWDRLDGTLDEAGLADAVCAAFEVDRSTAADDARALVRALAEQGLVEAA